MMNIDPATPALRLLESAPGAEVTLAGRQYLYFAGTGYLGLQGHPRLVAASRDAAETYGIHTATSRAGYGTSPPVAEVERLGAQWLNSESALYLISGYAGNFAVAAAIAGDYDLVLIDEHAHDCLREAVRCLAPLSVPPLVFRHTDTQHVAELLAKHAGSGLKPLLLSDGVFAVSGDLAPIGDYLDLLARYPGAGLLVDDAHGLGVLGTHGRGSLELAGVDPRKINVEAAEARGGPRVFHTTTLSKAVGGQGGLIAGSRAFLERIRCASGWLRGASAPASPVAGATAEGLKMMIAEPELRERLTANVTMLRSSLAELGLAVPMTPAPVIGIRLESANRMAQVRERLETEGILIAHSRDYSGAGPDGMLRIAVFATHTPEMIDRLVAALGRALTKE